MNNRFGKTFDDIISQQNEFLKKIMSKKFIFEQDNGVGKAPGPYAPGKAPNVSQAAPSSIAQATPSSTAQATPSGTAQATPSGATQTAPSGQSAPNTPVDPVTDVNAQQMRRIFSECGASITTKDEQHFEKLFNKWYTTKKRVLLIVKIGGKNKIKTISMSKFKNNAKSYINLANKNNAAVISYLENDDVKNYEQYGIALLKANNPNLNDNQAKARFTKRITSRKMIPVVVDNKININFSIDDFLADTETYEDNAMAYLKANKETIQNQKKEQETTANKVSLKNKWKEFKTAAKELANKFPSARIAAACDGGGDNDLALPKDFKMYSIDGAEIASWGQSGEIDSDDEIEEFRKYLNKGMTSKQPTHPESFYAVLQNLTTNSDYQDINDTAKEAVNKVFDPIKQEIQNVIKQFPEFCGSHFNGRTGNKDYDVKQLES